MEEWSLMSPEGARELYYAGANATIIIEPIANRAAGNVYEVRITKNVNNNEKPSREFTINSHDRNLITLLRGLNGRELQDAINGIFDNLAECQTEGPKDLNINVENGAIKFEVIDPQGFRPSYFEDNDNDNDGIWR